MTTYEHTISKILLCGVVLLALLWEYRRSKTPPQKQKMVYVLTLLAVLSFLAYYRFGFFPVYVHFWEHFHYKLSAKYFHELGYDGLYVASIEAQQQAIPNLPIPPVIRDLRNYEIVPTASVAQHRQEVVNRFSSERWQGFVRDHTYYLRAMRWASQRRGRDFLQALATLRLDHGFNATPMWIFMGKLFAWLPANQASSRFLVTLDVLLLLLMFLVVIQTYGLRAGCLGMVVFGLGYGWHYGWIGGGFLRQDWLVATVVGICLLKRKRTMTAGMLLGYATMVRIFPIILLFGPGVKAIQDLLAHRKPAWFVHLLLGFTASVIISFAAGSFTGQGTEAWRQFAVNITTHHGSLSANRVGFQNVLLYGPATMRVETEQWYEHISQVKRERQIIIVVASVVALGLLVAAIWRVPLDESLMLGIAAIFLVTSLACYYWVMCIVFALRRNTAVLVGFLVLNIGVYGVQLFRVPAPRIMYGLVLSWGLALLVGLWIGPDSWQTLRGWLAGTHDAETIS